MSALKRQTLIDIAEGEVVYIIKTKNFQHYSDPVLFDQMFRELVKLLRCDVEYRMET